LALNKTEKWSRMMNKNLGGNHELFKKTKNILHSEGISLTQLMQLAKIRCQYQKSQLYPGGPVFKLRTYIGYMDRLFMVFLASANQIPAYYLKVFCTASIHPILTIHWSFNHFVLYNLK
jgi:hypothetical protein